MLHHRREKDGGRVCYGYRHVFRDFRDGFRETRVRFTFSVTISADFVSLFVNSLVFVILGSVIATIPVGYADGIDRRLGRGAASFSVNGHRAPTIGNICMDMCMLDVTGIPCAVGDTVTVFGTDPGVTELAALLGTIPYEILASIPRRIHRLVVK